MPDIPDSHNAARAGDPAAFVTPEPASKEFRSDDDRTELSAVRRQRRDALKALRRGDRNSWRDAP